MAIFQESFLEFADKVKVATGTYTGTGKIGTTPQVTVNCGFKPKVVYLYTITERLTNGYYNMFGMFVNGSKVIRGFQAYSGNGNLSVSSYAILTYTDTGFTISGEPINSWAQLIYNYSGNVYGYIAIG